jgi:hypothetical protein
MVRDHYLTFGSFLTPIVSRFYLPLKKLSLAGLAKLSRLRYSSAGYRGLGVHDRPMYTAG